MAEQCTLANFTSLWQMESSGAGEVHGAAMVGAPCFETDFYTHRAETEELIVRDNQKFKFKMKTVDQFGMYVGLSPFFNPPRRIYRITQDCIVKDFLYGTVRSEVGLGGPGFDTTELAQWGIWFEETGGGGTAIGYPVDPSNPSGGFDASDSQFEFDDTTEIALIRENDDIILEVPDTAADLGTPGWVTGGGKARWTYSRPAWQTSDFTQPWILEGVQLVPVNPNPEFKPINYGLERPLYDQADYAALRLVLLPFGGFGIWDIANAGLQDVYFCTEDATPSEKIDCDELVT